MAKKFLLIASFPESILRFRGPLIVAIQAKGFVVHVAAPGLDQENEKLVERLSSMNVAVHKLTLNRAGINPFQDCALLIQLFFLMLRIRPSVVMSYTVKPVIFGSLGALLARVPRVYALVTGLGYVFTNERLSFLSKIVSALYRISLRGVQGIIFQNPDDRATFLARKMIGADAKTFIVNGSGIDIEEFRHTPESVGEPRFLMVCRLLADKGVREYAAAAKIVRNFYPNAVFELAGWIDVNPSSITQIELDGWIADEAIVFLGRLEDVRAAIKASSVYVLPSYREGTPRTVLEAMAIGRAIITTDAPGCRETVIEGQNGYLVDVGSVDSLVAAMIKLIRSPDMVVSMGIRSRQIAEEKYDVHKVNAQMLAAMDLSD